MKEEKRRRQEETKAVLDYSLKLNMKKKAKDVQQELALDMKLLEQMLAATTNEAMQTLQRKVCMYKIVGNFHWEKSFAKFISHNVYTIGKIFPLVNLPILSVN